MSVALLDQSNGLGERPRRGRAASAVDEARDRHDAAGHVAVGVNTLDKEPQEICDLKVGRASFPLAGVVKDRRTDPVVDRMKIDRPDAPAGKLKGCDAVVAPTATGSFMTVRLLSKPAARRARSASAVSRVSVANPLATPQPPAGKF